MSLIQRTHAWWLPVAALAALVLGGCRPERPAAPETAALEPAAAVEQLLSDLRNDDLVGYVRHALPPDLHRRISLAWDQGLTIWPLTALPLDDRLPALITTLAAPDAEKTLLAGYNRQFAGATRELHSAAATLGLFARQYLAASGEFSPAERAHYAQVVDALAGWGQRAPLADPARARTAIPQLVAAARLTGLAGADGFREAGMERGLTRIAPFLARLRTVLAGYGLDLDEALASATVGPALDAGDSATVPLEYTLAGRSIRAELRLVRRDGGWYLADLLRHAEAETGPADSAADTAAAAAAPPATP